MPAKKVTTTKKQIQCASPTLIAPTDDLAVRYAALVRENEALRAAYAALWATVHR